MEVIIGVLELQGRGIPGRPVAVPPALDEEVPVGLALGAEGKAHGPADDGAGKTPLGAIAIGPHTPVAAGLFPEHGRFQAEAPDIAVFPDQGGVEVRIPVPARTGEALRHHPDDDRARLPVPLQGRLESPERPGSQPDAPAGAARLGIQMDRRPGSILLRSLQTPGFLPVIQGNLPDPVRRKTPQVHLHVLGIVHLDAVQEDARMLAPEAPDIDRLETAHAPVVLDLNPGETPQDIGHLRRRRCRLPEIHLLGGLNDGKHLDGPDGSRRKRIRLLGLQAPGGGQDEEKPYESGTAH